MTQSPLDIRGLSLVAGDTSLLFDVCLTLLPGEKVAIVGPNGAGKSSLLKTVAGLHRHYTGQALVRGDEIRALSPKSLSRRVSLVPQRLEFVPRFRVREFLELSECPDLNTLEPSIRQLFDRYLPELSGGELQRVVLAGAVAQGADLLLLDEPTAHLDPTGESEMERVIARYHSERSISYLLVTHDIAFAARAAERIVIMREGRIAWDGATTDPRLPIALSDAYRCPFTRVTHPTSGESIIIAG